MDLKDREYHVTEDQTPIGPFSFEELRSMNIADKALIWYKGLSDWIALNDLPELKKALKETDIPPPIPKERVENVYKEPEKSEKNTTPENSHTSKTISSNEKKIIVFWIAIHLFALITSYSEIDIFSDGPDSSEFWPFVNYKSCGNYPQSFFNDGIISDAERESACSFNGLFNEYDWSEFAIYMSLPIYIILRRRI